jgi:hypothetical protein
MLSSMAPLSLAFAGATATVGLLMGLCTACNEDFLVGLGIMSSSLSPPPTPAMADDCRFFLAKVDLLQVVCSEHGVLCYIINMHS